MKYILRCQSSYKTLLQDFIDDIVIDFYYDFPYVNGGLDFLEIEIG